MQFNTRLSTVPSWLTQLVAAESLAVFRIVFGLAMAWWAFDYLRLGRVRLLCAPGAFHFTYYGFDWVQPWSENGMVIQFAVLLVAGLLMAVGALYRPAAVVFALGFTHFFLVDRIIYQNHYYLIVLLSWTMAVVPANRVWSVDACSGTGNRVPGNRVPGNRVPGNRVPGIPRWSLLLVQFHIALPYVYGGIAKIEPDWLSTDPMRFMLLSQTWFPVIGPWLGTKSAAVVLTGGGLLLDLLVVPGLLWKRTRAVAYCMAVGFHLTNSFLFNIHVFPWLMISGTPILFAADWPRRLLRLPRHRPQTASVDTRSQDTRTYSCRSGIRLRQCCGLVLLSVYVLFHLMWPLRHLLYEGNSGWTERGHYFSWRMMLRGKTTGIRYYITDSSSGDTWNADIRRYLNPEQQGKFARDPEMILHFAHFLADEYQRQQGLDVEVRALVLTSMNGRRPQLLIDPRVNLAAEPRGWHHRDWIKPLTEPRPAEPWTVPLNEWERHVDLPDLPFLKQSY